MSEQMVQCAAPDRVLLAGEIGTEGTGEVRRADQGDD